MDGWTSPTVTIPSGNDWFCFQERADGDSVVSLYSGYKVPKTSCAPESSLLPESWSSGRTFYTGGYRSADFTSGTGFMGGQSTIYKGDDGDETFIRLLYAQQDWAGEMEFFDVSTSTLSNLRPGEILRDRDLALNSRNIITAMDQNSDGEVEQIAFNGTNAGTLASEIFARYDAVSASVLPTSIQALDTLSANNVISYVVGNDQVGMRSRDIFGDSTTWRLGDMPNSDVVVVGRRNGYYDTLDGYADFMRDHTGDGVDEPIIVLVGSNDGMLHAFDMATGEELWAYIPSNVLQYLPDLTRTDYDSNWRPLVDGRIVVHDVYFGGSWHTLAAFGQKNGGDTYVVLDITDRDSPSLLFELSDARIGTKSWNRPSFLRVSSAVSPQLPSTVDWYLTVATSEGRTADGVDALFWKIAAVKAAPVVVPVETVAANAPAGTRATTIIWTNSDDDFSHDRGYLGTEEGRLYRIMVDPTMAANTVATVFVGSNARPITSTPVAVWTYNHKYDTSSSSILASERYAVFVGFGTGRYDSSADILAYGSTDQRVYGLFDPAVVDADDHSIALSNITDATLQRQNYDSLAISMHSDLAVATLSSSKDGYYIDLASTPASFTSNSNVFLEPTGMVVADIQSHSGALIIPTFVPNSSCNNGGMNFVSIADYSTGAGLIIDKSIGNRGYAENKFLSTVLDYDGDSSRNVSDIIAGITLGKMEPVVASNVTSFDLTADPPVVHDSAIGSNDIGILSTLGTVPAMTVYLSSKGTASHFIAGLATITEKLVISDVYLDSVDYSARDFNFFRKRPDVLSYSQKR